MRYEQLRSLLEETPILALSDIRHVAPRFHLPRLSEWNAQKKILKLRQGIYTSPHFIKNEAHLYFAANKLYPPSYVSFETVLSIYQIIPDTVYRIISATSKKTTLIETPVGTFYYHHIKFNLMFGYNLMPVEKWTYRIACLEKAILDFLYLNNHVKTNDDFAALRWNPSSLNEINWDQLNAYLNCFNNFELTQRVDALQRYIECFR